MATCPTDESIATGKSREIMLYSEFFKKTIPPSLFFSYLLGFFVWVYYLLFSVKKPPPSFPGQLLPFALDMRIYILPISRRHFFHSSIFS
jgi:hypothetical protein